MSQKILIVGLLLIGIGYTSNAQRIVVDTASTNKYLMNPPKKAESASPAHEEELSFSDRAYSIGVGILNRLKARLNLEEAAESLKDKKEKFLGSKEEEQEKDDGN